MGIGYRLIVSHFYIYENIHLSDLRSYNNLRSRWDRYQIDPEANRFRSSLFLFKRNRHTTRSIYLESFQFVAVIPLQ